jgi:hypothetical protein
MQGFYSRAKKAFDLKVDFDMVDSAGEFYA